MNTSSLSKKAFVTLGFISQALWAAPPEPRDIEYNGTNSAELGTGYNYSTGKFAGDCVQGQAGTNFTRLPGAPERHPVVIQQVRELEEVTLLLLIYKIDTSYTEELKISDALPLRIRDNFVASAKDPANFKLRCGDGYVKAVTAVIQIRELVYVSLSNNRVGDFKAAIQNAPAQSKISNIVKGALAATNPEKMEISVGGQQYGGTLNEFSTHAENCKPDAAGVSPCEQHRVACDEQRETDGCLARIDDIETYAMNQLNKQINLDDPIYHGFYLSSVRVEPYPKFLFPN